MIDARQFRQIVVDPTLKGIGLHSPAASDLVVGTALAESGLRWLIQRGGPAISLFQLEPATITDLRRYCGERQPLLALRIARHVHYDWRALDDLALFDRVTTDLRLACALCRVRYYMVPDPLPEAGDVASLAQYWVRWYNAGGKGTVAHFVEAYVAAHPAPNAHAMQVGA